MSHAILLALIEADPGARLGGVADAATNKLTVSEDEAKAIVAALLQDEHPADSREARAAAHRRKKGKVAGAAAPADAEVGSVRGLR